MSLPRLNDDPHGARVTAAQQLLFPAAPRAICNEMGLNWWAAIKLYEDGWLSFCPEATPILDEAQEAELRFVGSLAVAGCDRPMLATLLDGLLKPYCYRVSRVYYDWTTRHWRLLPDPDPKAEAVFGDWLEQLVGNGDVATLTGILDRTHDALARLSGEPTGPRALPQTARSAG